MHNNFYFFKQMVPVLEEKLKGSALIDCFSQSKDELILNFGKLDIGNFYIKAYLTSHFSCLSFLQTFTGQERIQQLFLDPLQAKGLQECICLKMKDHLLFNLQTKRLCFSKCMAIGPTSFLPRRISQLSYSKAASKKTLPWIHLN